MQTPVTMDTLLNEIGLCDCLETAKCFLAPGRCRFCGDRCLGGSLEWSLTQFPSRREKVIGLVNFSFTMPVTLAGEAPQRIQHQLQQMYQLLLLPLQTVLNVMSTQAENTTQGPSGTLGLRGPFI